MVVEDEPINMMLISEVLGRMGLDVIRVGNGKEAIGTPDDNDIALIFMDVNMPDREKCLDSGMNDYLSKPFRLEELQAILHQYLAVN